MHDDPFDVTSLPSLRVLGIDLGERRVGVALSNSEGTMAMPFEVVKRSGDRQRDHRALRALAEEGEVTAVVVGLPLSLDGSLGPAARGVLEEVAQLRAALSNVGGSAGGLPVATYDERLTTVTADRGLMEMRMKADARRRVVDKVAAAVMLQSWLDSVRAGWLEARDRSAGGAGAQP